MAIDIEDVVVVGGLVYAYYYFTKPGSYSIDPITGSVVPGSVPAVIPPNIPNPGSINAGTGTVTDPTLIPAQASINQQIQQMNADITAGVSVATAAFSVIATLAHISAAVAGPIGVAIAGVAILIKSLLTDVHLYANALVQRYENPFGQGVIAIIQKETDELNAGTLTLDDATNARDAIVGGWALYQAKMHEIQTQGTDWYIVATQSLNNLDNQYKGLTLPNGKTLDVGMGGAYGDQPNYGFMSTWIDWLNGRVANLGGV